MEKASEKVEELKKSLHHLQKIIKLAKNEASCLAVKEDQTEELKSDSEDEKRIKRSVRKKCLQRNLESQEFV